MYLEFNVLCFTPGVDLNIFKVEATARLLKLLVLFGSLLASNDLFAYIYYG